MKLPVIFVLMLGLSLTVALLAISNMEDANTIMGLERAMSGLEAADARLKKADDELKQACLPLMHQH